MSQLYLLTIYISILCEPSVAVPFIHKHDWVITGLCMGILTQQLTVLTELRRHIYGLNPVTFFWYDTVGFTTAALEVSPNHTDIILYLLDRIIGKFDHQMTQLLELW